MFNRKPPYRVIDRTASGTGIHELIDGPSDDFEDCVATAETHRQERYSDASNPAWGDVWVIDAEGAKIWPPP